MQIRNIKGIAERLPEAMNVDIAEIGYEGEVYDRDDVQMTDIEISECAEVDVENTKIKMWDNVIESILTADCKGRVNIILHKGKTFDDLAKSGCIKWKEGGK